LACNNATTEPQPLPKSTQTKSSRSIGQRGEFLVAEKLLEHGWDIAHPLSDSSPFDLLVSKGDRIWRIQIKTTRGLIMYKSSTSPNFQFQTNHGCRVKSMYDKALVDFFIFCALDCMKFWVLPFVAVRSMTTKIYGGRNCKFAIYANAWDLLETDKTS
jgi:hypothetical protein